MANPREFLSGLCNIDFNFDDEKQDNRIIFVVPIGSKAIQKTMISFFQQRISFFFRFFPILQLLYFIWETTHA